MALEYYIVVSGIFQLVLVIVSPAIPVLLSWRKGLAQTPLLLRQLFWTYSIYIWVSNFAFGLLSAFAPTELTGGTLLSFLVSLFIGIYWFGRILIQFFYFSREGFPKGIIYTIGEILLVSLFIFLTIVYLFTAHYNFKLLSV